MAERVFLRDQSSEMAFASMLMLAVNQPLLRDDVALSDLMPMEVRIGVWRAPRALFHLCVPILQQSRRRTSCSRSCLRRDLAPDLQLWKAHCCPLRQIRIPTPCRWLCPLLFGTTRGCVWPCQKNLSTSELILLKRQDDFPTKESCPTRKHQSAQNSHSPSFDSLICLDACMGVLVQVRSAKITTLWDTLGKSFQESTSSRGIIWY